MEEAFQWRTRRLIEAVALGVGAARDSKLATQLLQEFFVKDQLRAVSRENECLP